MKTNFMKANFKFLAIILSLGFFLQSCSSDDDGAITIAPIITNFEFGEGTDHSTDPVAERGTDLHLEAEIYAENVISSITLRIHSHDEITLSEGEVEWDFEQVYTDASYQVINAVFHEHIDIPATAPAGEYHVELIVVDELGNSTESEGHLDVLAPITISDYEMDETVLRGNDFHVEFMVDAHNGIHEISVDIHAHGLEVAAGEVEWDFEMVYDEFHDQTEAEFHKHIDVPTTAPAGEYHVTFTIEDENGNIETYETHIDITA
ncbi:DUF4625 domain-containing protein [Formosa sp. PL04]|uniref:DUF4625 domain-containing protein n=1 Tax=Formosa sp. PL04 TaxID=3081755 RepID=UPI0029810D6D|nr:DUF4625 domain-containing protein [Formosa sp. PL04]MDW5290251.1 DUF4625 domain-containing protein [Formosa sp. PL04]